MPHWAPGKTPALRTTRAAAFDVAFARLDLRPAQLTFLRHSQVRLIYRLDLIMVLPIAFRKLLNDLIDLGSRKSNAQSGQELNFLADSEFVRRHPSTRCANARRLLPLNHREHPDESIARRRTGRRAISCTQARSDFLLGIPRRLLGIPRRIASLANTGTLPVPFGYSLSGDCTPNGATPASLRLAGVCFVSRRAPLISATPARTGRPDTTGARRPQAWGHPSTGSARRSTDS